MRLIDADKLIKDGWVLTKHGESNSVIDTKSIADVPTETESMNVIFTNEHREYINKQITKALKGIDYETIVKDAIEKEFDALYEECRLQQDIEDMVFMVIREHLVKVGLLNGENNK